MALCLRCGRPFEPRRRGHVFCSNLCRHRHQGETGKRPVLDHEQIARLFDEGREPEERVRDDDWHPTPGSGFEELDAHQTVGQRRRWYLALVEEGDL